jgi:hypothetical protein
VLLAEALHLGVGAALQGFALRVHVCKARRGR